MDAQEGEDLDRLWAVIADPTSTAAEVWEAWQELRRRLEDRHGH